MIPAPMTSFRCDRPLDLYDSPQCVDLATQAAVGRYLTVVQQDQATGNIQLRLQEDHYLGWIPQGHIAFLQPTATPYQPHPKTRPEIEAVIPQVIAFTQAAKNVPNQYRWGGAIAPHYDCSGLVQTAFASVGVWLPRDSYQQAYFTQPLEREALAPGDLLFFAKKTRVDHVALYLGQGDYIHSSGRDQGRNTIAIDSIDQPRDAIARTYHRQLVRFGRIMASL